MGGWEANDVLGSHAGLTSFSWAHESVVTAAVRRCCLARRMLPLRVSLALFLVLVLRLARLPDPLLIPVLEFLWHAPAVWVDEHQHVFSRFFDLGYLGYPKRSMPGFGSRYQQMYFEWQAWQKKGLKPQFSCRNRILERLHGTGALF